MGTLDIEIYLVASQPAISLTAHTQVHICTQSLLIFFHHCPHSTEDSLIRIVKKHLHPCPRQKAAAARCCLPHSSSRDCLHSLQGLKGTNAIEPASLFSSFSLKIGLPRGFQILFFSGGMEHIVPSPPFQIPMRALPCPAWYV